MLCGANLQMQSTWVCGLVPRGCTQTRVVCERTEPTRVTRRGDDQTWPIAAQGVAQCHLLAQGAATYWSIARRQTLYTNQRYRARFIDLFRTHYVHKMDLSDIVSMSNLTPLSYHQYVGPSFYNLTTLSNHQYTDVLIEWVEQAKVRAQTGVRVVWLTDESTPSSVIRALAQAPSVRVYDYRSRGIVADVLYSPFGYGPQFDRYLFPLIAFSGLTEAFLYVTLTHDIEQLGNTIHWSTPPTVPERAPFVFSS